MGDDLLRWQFAWTLAKYGSDEDAALRRNPIEVVHIPHNLATTAGITRVAQLIIGTSTDAFSAARARIGVGDSTTAAAVGQTALQAATNRLYKPMDAGYPQASAGSMTWASTFALAEANFAWQEWGVDSGGTSGVGTAVVAPFLNRRVQSLGTKPGTQAWIMTGTRWPRSSLSSPSRAGCRLTPLAPVTPRRPRRVSSPRARSRPTHPRSPGPS
jgi:hypothetical protein